MEEPEPAPRLTPSINQPSEGAMGKSANGFINQSTNGVMRQHRTSIDQSTDEVKDEPRPSLAPSATSVTFVATVSAVEENDEKDMAYVEQEFYSGSMAGGGQERLEVQRRRRRSSIFGKENSTTKALDVKEEPYGWVVVLAVFMIHAIVDGVTNSFGALYDEFLVYYNADAVSTSMVMSILLGATYGCGPLASFLCERFGLRSVALLGSLLSCAGCLLSLLATSIWHLALSYGALMGLGFGFMYLSAIVTVASWFEKRRSIAVSIAVCGTGFGTFLFSPLTTFLLDFYDLNGCFWIIAGIAMQGAVFAMLLRTPPRHRETEQLQSAILQPMKLHGRRQTAIIIRMRRWIKDEIDWNLITNTTFILYCVASFLGGISCYVPYMYLADRAKSESGIEPAYAAWLLSFVGASNIVGRLTSGVLSYRKVAGNVVIYSCACVAAGLGTAFSVWCTTFYLYAIYSSLFGFTGGIIVAMQTVVLTDIVGVERISNAFGILLFVQGVAVFVGPPFAGYLIEIEREKGPLKYQLCFVVFGLVMVMSGLLLLLIPLLNWIKKMTEKRAHVEEDRQMEEFSVIESN
ncbi:putative Monocarboxylate transporter 3 [Hypsibius exemplaris]|uniref:Monocarboxylate transporter 3 n=1 Tax=Hypsibius exemplaris TaxID=2072580 RepID=A0A1W0WWL9_HYPEX|nr:putative Monocarboxylate transporter 3 [Hypsibius exemplaris]